MSPDPHTIEPLLVPTPEAARLLSVSERWLWGQTQPRGPIPCVRLCGRVLYSPASLREWVRQQEAAAVPADDSHREAPAAT